MFLLVGSLGISFSIIAFWMLNDQFISQRNLEFTWVAQNRNRLLKQGMENALEPVRITRDFVQSAGKVTRDQFHEVAAPLLSRNPGIEMIGLIFRAENKNRHPVQLHDTDFDQQIEAFSTLTYVEARGNTGFKPGYNVISTPVLKDAMLRAQNTGLMAVSGRIELISQDKNKYGVMAYLPLYKSTHGTVTITDKYKELVGFVVAVMRLDELAHVAISYLEPRGVDLLIHDESAKEEDRFLEFYASRLKPSAEEKLIWQRLATTETKITEVVQMADRNWSIIAVPNARFRSVEAFAEGAWVVLVGGVLLTILLTVYLLRMKLGMQERLSMSQKLKDREALFWQMTESVDDIFWAITVDMSRFLYVSPAFESIWGLSCEAVYSDPQLFSNTIHSEDKVRWFDALREANRYSSPMEVVYRIIRMDGTQRWIRDNIFPVHDELGKVYRLVGVAEDITEKKQADDALRDSENKLRTLFNQSPDTIMTVDKEGNILLMNRGASLEASSGRIIGKHSADLLPPSYRKGYRELLAHSFLDGEVSYLPYLTEESTWWEIRIVPIIENDQVMASMVISTDITEKRNLQAQAIRNAHLASIGTLATGVAHDINNPNNAIQTSAALFEHVWKDAMQVLKEYYNEQGDFSLAGLSFADEGGTLGGLISEIKDNSRRIDAIVGNLKHLGKNDASDLNEDVNINAALQAAARVLGSNIRKHTNNWTMELAEDLPCVKGNLQQLEQVFINVMLNALQSLPDKCQGVRVESVADYSRKIVIIRVLDQGVGIAEEDIPRITEPFFTTRLKIGGTGLGLSISSTIIENHGGTIIFTSSKDSGTTVALRLPMISTP